MHPNDMAAVFRTEVAKFIAAQFPEGGPPETIRNAVLAHPGLAGIDRADLTTALDSLLGHDGTVPATAAPFRPRLLVDWGELPQIGRSARPLFSLIGPGTADKPTVRIAIDRGLDNDPADPLRQVRTEETGLWTFYVPFSLTAGGLDARAGLYVIDVDVTFPHADDGQPRFLRTQIRLNIPDGSSDRRELVIDGDGQSVVNLAGTDLRSYSRVVLKGGDKSIVNVQSFAQQMAAASEAPKTPVVFEYELKVNRDIQMRLPTVVPVPRPSKADALSLAVGDRRIHVIARKRATFGRSRENDVCLRFLPRSDRNDEGSRAISRTHMALDVSDDGLMLSDESAKGVDVDCDPVKGVKTFTHLDAHGIRSIDLPSKLSVDQALEMDLAIFAHDPDDPDFRSDLGWDDVCFEVAGEPASRIWQMARSSGVETARVLRRNNLPDEEYVFLYRHATIGRSAKDFAIVLPGIGIAAADVRLLYAGRMFWLHSGGRVAISLDGRRIEGACLIPLAVGQSLGIGGTSLRVGPFAQLELDEQAAAAPASAAADEQQPGVEARSGSLGELPTRGRAPQATPSSPAAAIPPPPPDRMRAAAVPPPPPGSAVPPPPPPPSARMPPPPPRSGQTGGPADSVLSSADPIRRALASVAVITGRDGHGSGFLAAPGILVTNYHVVADEIAGDIVAVFPDNRSVAERSYRIDVLHEDPVNDLAFLRIDAEIPHLVPCPGFRHRNGHRIVAIGSPGVGGAGRLENLVTDGRLGPIFEDSAEGVASWALSMTVNPGNSGGPVVDAETGEVLAVIVAKFTDTDGHSLAVPYEHLVGGLDRARSVAESSRDSSGGSLHRQRWCLRKIDELHGIAAGAAGRLLADMSELSGTGTDSVYSVVSDFTGGAGANLADAVRAFKPTIDGELTLLRSDSCCPDAIRTSLERAWGATERLVRQLASEVGRLEVDIFADDVRTGLSRATNIIAGLRAELLGGDHATR